MARIIRETGPAERNVVFEEDDVSYATGYSPLARVVWYVLGIINTLLGLRFLLRLFGANPAAAFTDFIYAVTSPLVSPFRNVIPATGIGSGVVEWSTLLAMLVYWLLAYAIVRLFAVSRPLAGY